MKKTNNQTILSREQETISRKNHRKTAKELGLKKGFVLHHIDETLRHNDIERYIQWRKEDVVMLSRSEHARIHQIGVPKTEAHKKAISDYQKGRPKSLEQREKMKESAKAQTTKSAEHKLHISEGMIRASKNKKHLQGSILLLWKNGEVPFRGTILEAVEFLKCSRQNIIYALKSRSRSCCGYYASWEDELQTIENIAG